MRIEKCFGIDAETARRLIEATSVMTNEKSGDNRFQNTKVYLFETYAVLKMQNLDVRNIETQDTDLKHLERLAETLLDLQVNGVHVVPILAFQCCDGNGYIIQPRAKGAEMYDRARLSDKDYMLGRVELFTHAPQQHFDAFVTDIIKMTNAGVLIDFVGKDNFFYDESIGFQFIDLNAHHDYVYGLCDDKPHAERVAIHGCFLPCWFDTMPQYRDTVSKIMSEMTDAECAQLRAQNRHIFEKCKTALVNNGITEEAIHEAVTDVKFYPQLRPFALI